MKTLCLFILLKLHILCWSFLCLFIYKMFVNDNLVYGRLCIILMHVPHPCANWCGLILTRKSKWKGSWSMRDIKNSIWWETLFSQMCEDKLESVWHRNMHQGIIRVHYQNLFQQSHATQFGWELGNFICKHKPLMCMLHPHARWSWVYFQTADQWTFPTK